MLHACEWGKKLSYFPEKDLGYFSCVTCCLNENKAQTLSEAVWAYPVEGTAVHVAVRTADLQYSCLEASHVADGSLCSPHYLLKQEVYRDKYYTAF